MKEQNTTVYTIQNVNSALELLEALTDFPEGLPMQNLAGRVGLNRNKTFRLLSTLCEKGLIEREPASGNYRLGVYSMAFAQKILKNANVINYAHPIVEELARKHHEAVYMTVIKDDEVLFIDMADCDHQIKAAAMVGKRLPFFTNAAGKVMKALDSRDLLDKFIKKRGKRGAHPDLNSFRSEMEEIRAKGVAVDRGGLGEGIISVAVAVRDYAGKVVGAITLIGPSFRMLTERLDREIIPSLREGADILSGRFGYSPA